MILFYDSFTGDLFGILMKGTENSIKLSFAANLFSILIWLQIIFLEKKLTWFRWTIIDKILLIYCFWVVITTLSAYNFENSLRELMRLPAFVSIYLFTRYFFSRGNSLIVYLNLSFAAIATIGIFSLYKISTGQPYLAVGVFILPLAPLVYLNFRSDIKPPFFYSIFLAAASFSLLISESRRMFLAIGIIWLISLLKNNRRLLYLIPAFIMAYFLIVKIEKQGEGRYTQTFTEITEINSVKNNREMLDQISTNRWSLWDAAIGMIKAYPVFGVGVGNMNELMPEYGKVRKQRAHNIILDVTGQLGIPGLIIFIILNYLAFRELVRLNKWSPSLDGISLSAFSRAITLALVVVLISALFGGSVLFDKWGWIYYGVVASLVASEGDLIAQMEPASLPRM